MEHLGDITKLDGAKIQPVHLITFGSPCQDLSSAGARKGLSGARSGLFSEAVRLFKEMRNATDGQYPAFVLWENVTGAFSSQKGEDFREVLTQLASACQGNTSIPRPSGGKWQPAGAVVGDGFSLAWRSMDAKYWGVPQRRARIALVVDFTAGRAPEILFEPESLSGDFATVQEKWRNLTCRAERSVGETGAVNHLLFENHSQDIRYTGPHDVSTALTAGSSGLPFIVTSINCRKGRETENISGTLMTNNSLDSIYPIRIGDSIRMLTPLECERLQGFPDAWTDIGAWIDTNGKLHKFSSDTARYKTLGNSIALPQWFHVLHRISRFLPENPTLGSLFDGIGGFPLIWETLHGKGTAIWASEIEEFPIAVTKYHFNKQKG